MKHIFSILTIIALLTVLTTYGQTSSADKNEKIFHTVEFDFLEGCETGQGNCDPVTIIRQTFKDSIIVLFPSGGTQTDVYLYADNDSINWMSETPQDQPTALRHDRKFTGQGTPQLDLTGLPDGTYRPLLFGCGLGGGFELIIKTASE